MNCIEMDLIQGRFQLKASVLIILLHSEFTETASLS